MSFSVPYCAVSVELYCIGQRRTNMLQLMNKYYAIIHNNNRQNILNNIS